MNFHVGQKVVCINDQNSFKRVGIWDFSVKMGEIYTIRWIGEFPFEPDRKFGLGVRLVEVQRKPELPPWEDYPYSIHRFRPLIERKTDISIFTTLLNPANHKKLESA